MGFWADLRDTTARVAVARTYSRKEVAADATTSAAWQSEAWRVWEKLGEIHYPTTQIARLVSRLDWNVTDEGRGSKVETEELVELFDNPGLAEVTRVIALNLIVAGEAWLTTMSPTDDQPPWVVYSVVEPNLKTRLEEVGLNLRVWTPDPRDPNKPDSGVRAAINPANELIALQNLSLAQIHSRIASNGILLRPNTRKPLVDEDGDPVDFAQMLHDTFEAAITDTASAAAWAPIDIEVPADEIEFWTHLTFERPYDEHIDTRMERVIRRIALALDIWPELLLGVADINHWGSWFLSEDTWRSSTAPLANQVAQALEVAVLEVTGREVTIEPDPAVLLARRSSVRDALNAAWLGAIGLKYVREVIGASEEDAATPEELDIIRLASGQRRSESRAGITTGEDEMIGTPGSGDQDSIQAAFAPADIAEGLGVSLVRVDDQLTAWLEGAATTITESVRTQIGVRLRRSLRGDPRSVTIDGVPNSQVAAQIGEATFDVVDVDNLVRTGIRPIVEAWSDVADTASRRIVELTGISITDGQWADARRRSTEILDQQLYTHIVSTLMLKNPGIIELRDVVAAAGID